MRQTAKDPLEVAFRKALENLRWSNCDDDDIALLRTRLAGSRPELSVDAEGFKNVSVITSLNRDKDVINSANCARFAAETGQELEDFFSVDTLSSGEPKRRDPKKARRVYSTAKTISRTAQICLWNQPPCTSEQIPGKLSICRGMPVIIRYNEATELCITRGQEARIVGWTALKYPKWKGRKCLDTLYVELVNPPHSVNLPHLPKNVVPLTRRSESIEAQLPDDQYMRLSRSQIPVLPNFAMTDYSSQGKTREWNVVDLAECRNFQAAYTCLSRGTSLGRTLIIRDFKNSLLRGNLDGALRQEYRELGYLSTLTDLQYKGVIPPDLIKKTRWETIQSYREWKKTAGLANGEAPALPKDHMAPPTNAIRYELETISALTKRKEREFTEKEKPKTKRTKKAPEAMLANQAWASPTGPTWDSRDWSCAYDTWTFILHWLWVSDRVKWSRILKTYSNGMCTMVEGFEQMAQRDPELELNIVRDRWRDQLREANPSQYPTGPFGCDIMSMSEDLLGYRFYGTRVSTSCAGCRQKSSEDAPNCRKLGPFTVVRNTLSIQDFVDEAFRPLYACVSCDGDVYARHRFAEIISFEVVEATDVLLNKRVDIGDWGMYRLAGVVYYGSEHFISRVITRDNKVYVHDGIEGPHSTYEGVLDNNFALPDLNACRTKQASQAIYVLADRISLRQQSDTDSDA
ncbi:hypothetical protein DFP72DRAFT_802495 [Ephemerocybe angulata]|uniref:Uncharacterized protein n=1 Tax=Ephemerocybe angulata TaxID=980116 RepID=A0A8H6ICU9_9AGAR|nr:hypothetical protein DFP72DRAFT_802495 [Tulosesus angulatus]